MTEAPKTNWLKTDPDNGYLIGPDGCRYANEHQAAHYGLLNLCGCGYREAAFNFCRDALSCFDLRGCYDNPPTKEWINAEDALKALVVNDPDIAAHVIAHMFNNLNLIEHGGSVGSSWLTDDGARIIDLGPMTDDLMREC
jgi:hypothetical protein